MTPLKLERNRSADDVHTGIVLTDQRAVQSVFCLRNILIDLRIVDKQMAISEANFDHLGKLITGAESQSGAVGTRNAGCTPLLTGDDLVGPELQLVFTGEQGHAGRVEKNGAGVLGRGRRTGVGIACTGGALLDDGKSRACCAAAKEKYA